MAKNKKEKKRTPADDPAMRKYLRDFESGRRNPDKIRCRFVTPDGEVIERPIRLGAAGNVAKADRHLFPNAG